MKQTTEIWKTIDGSDRYQVSNLGRVRNVNWNDRGIVKYVEGYANNTGYKYVAISINGKQRFESVHRLVAQAFIPNPDGLEQVDHIDNDRLNNVSTNLRWVSRKFNNTRPHAKVQRKLNPNKAVTHLHQFVKATKDGSTRYFKNARQCAIGLGCSHVLAIKVLRGDVGTAKGWNLEYVDRGLDECQQLNDALANRITKSMLKKDNVKKLAKDRKHAIKEHLKQMMIDYENDRHHRALNNLPKPETKLDKAIQSFKREARKILQIDTDGNLVKEWENTFKAQTETGLAGIYGCLFGSTPTCGGFVWRFKIEL